jgi:hypothetical protein
MPTLAELIAAKNRASATPGATPAAAAHAAAVKPGGDRLAQIKAALGKAKMGSNRNALPLGTGWFLLKNGVFKETEQSRRRISAFSFLCIHPLADGEGMAPNSPNYTGPRKGETYDVALFQDGSYIDSTATKNLQALAACMGWSKEYVHQLQASEEGITMIMELLKGLLCVSVDGTPTNQPCAFANQTVIEIVTKATVKEEKGKDGKPSYDATGNKKMVTYINTYWNKRIPLDEVLATLGETETIKVFGSQEAFMAAYENEQQLSQLG